MAALIVVSVTRTTDVALGSNTARRLSEVDVNKKMGEDVGVYAAGAGTSHKEDRVEGAWGIDIIK